MKGMDLVALSAGPGGEVALASSAGDAGIRRLAPLPFEAQANALAARGEFAAALELAALIPAERVRALPEEALACATPALGPPCVQALHCAVLAANSM